MLQVARLIIGKMPSAVLDLQKQHEDIRPTANLDDLHSSMIRVGESQEVHTRRFMEIKSVIVMVNDQDKALQFYTEKLGFVKKNDAPDGPFPHRTVGHTHLEDQQGIVVAFLNIEIEFSLRACPIHWHKQRFGESAIGNTRKDHIVCHSDITRIMQKNSRTAHIRCVALHGDSFRIVIHIDAIGRG